MKVGLGFRASFMIGYLEHSWLIVSFVFFCLLGVWFVPYEYPSLVFLRQVVGDVWGRRGLVVESYCCLLPNKS
jgi:ABC-type antimicrobial peptide transport system permease subunit